MRGAWKRVAADAALLVSLLFLPWQVTAVIALVGLFMFDTYAEAIAAGFLADAAYGAEIPKFDGAQYVATAAAGAAFFLSLYAKSVLRYYR